MAEGWTRDRFSRRRYVVEGEHLDKAKRIEILVRVDGRVLVHVQAREPGLLAFVSKPTEQGFEIDMVEAKGGQFADQRVPGDTSEPVADWQFEALDIGRGA